MKLGGFGFPTGMMGGFSLVGLVCGAVVTLSALMLGSRPHEQNAWSLLILVFSVVSFLNMGGFMVGGILGLIGGAIAYSNSRR